MQECRRDAAGRKRVKGLLLVGHENVPCGFQLRTGDPGDIADGDGNRERPASQAQGLPKPQTSIIFLRYSTLDQAKRGRREGLCVF